MDTRESIDERLSALEQLLNELNKKVNCLLIAQDYMGGWIKQEDIMKLTGLGKTTLYKLRKDNEITSSTIAERGVFYRLSDFEKLLNKNEKS